MRSQYHFRRRGEHVLIWDVNKLAAFAPRLAMDSALDAPPPDAIAPVAPNPNAPPNPTFCRILSDANSDAMRPTALATLRTMPLRPSSKKLNNP